MDIKNVKKYVIPAAMITAGIGLTIANYLNGVPEGDYYGDQVYHYNFVGAGLLTLTGFLGAGLVKANSKYYERETKNLEQKVSEV
jgi:hypothetical protein